MIDFNNAAFIKLKPTNDDAFVNNISPILVKGESILGTYKGIRDGVVFTTHRIIAINVQGITGKKKISHLFLILKFKLFLLKQLVLLT